MGYVHWPDREARDRQIRVLHAQGLSTRAIAELIGCHRTTVWEVANDQQARYNARRAAYNTSPEGLQRQRDYRARKAE